METQKTTQTNKEIDTELWSNFLDLEEQWRASLPKVTDKELLEIFPEAKAIIQEKIAEWEEKKNDLLNVIKKKLLIIKKGTANKFSRWYYREWVKVNEGEDLLELDNHIARLKRLSTIARGEKLKGRLTEEQIQQALATPIENLINQPLRKIGKVLVGHCLFHQEKHPSFYVYPATNSFFCFSCRRGGNAINFTMELYNFSFKKAVEFLLNNS